MIVAEIVALLIFGTTTWLVQDRQHSRRRALHDRLTVVAVLLSAAVVVAALVGVAVTWP
jgi:hypothetical protein